MKLPINAQLIGFLLTRGYAYVFSKTEVDQTRDPDICIVLTPAADEPLVEALPDYADTYYTLLEEPVQMAEGIDDINVVVQLSPNEIGFLKRFLLGSPVPAITCGQSMETGGQAFGSLM